MPRPANEQTIYYGNFMHVEWVCRGPLGHLNWQWPVGFN